MSDFIIVDTDILIDIARQVNEAIDCVERIEHQSTLAISVITQMELMVGCRNKTEFHSTDTFLQRFQLLKLDAEACDTALQLLRLYRLSHGLMIPDALIAATAITFNCPLISKNQRDYCFISGLQLLSYPDGMPKSS